MTGGGEASMRRTTVRAVIGGRNSVGMGREEGREEVSDGGDDVDDV